MDGVDGRCGCGPISLSRSDMDGVDGMDGMDGARQGMGAVGSLCQVRRRSSWSMY